MLLRNCLCVLLATVAAISLSAQVADGKLQIHHIDIGQGDAAVLISPNGKVVLFDAGKDMANRKDCNVETEYLDQLGVKQIDYICVFSAEVRKSEAVALGYPVMPVFDGLSG